MRVMKIFVLSLVLPIFCFTQAIQWKSLNGLTGIYFMREAAEGKLFAVSDVSIYYSTDDGRSWAPSNIPRAWMMEFVANGKTCVVYRLLENIPNYQQVYMSTDNGLNWTRILSAKGIHGNFMVSDSGIVFGINYSTCRIVRYNGIKWDTIGTNIPIVVGERDIGEAVVDHANNFFVLGGGYVGYVFVSTDYGRTWHTTFKRQWVRAICVSSQNNVIIGVSRTQDYNTDGGVYVSSDQGNSWVDLGLKDKYISSVTIDNSDNIYAATTIGVFRLRAMTGEWEYVGPSESEFVSTFAAKSGTVFTTSYDYNYINPESPDGVLYRSTDKGTFWSPSGPVANEIFSLISTSPSCILAGTLGDGILKTSNWGTSWAQSAPGSISDYVYSFAKGNSVVYAGTNDGLYFSTDNGDSWVNKTSHTFSGSAYSVVVLSDGKIITGTNFGIYTSSDAGRNWNQAGLSNSKVLFLANTPADVVYAATDDDGVFSSSDKGISWYSCRLSRDDIQTIVVNDAGHICVGVYGGIFRSTDNGFSWIQSTFTNTYVYAIAMNGDQDIIAGTYNGMFRSQNGGQNWTYIGFPEKTILSLTFDDNRNLIAGLYEGGVYMSALPLTSVEITPLELPVNTELFQNYPNPFNPATIIRYALPMNSHVILKVYDVQGKEVATLVDNMQDAGYKSVEWNISQSGISSGVYFYKLITPKFTQVRKLLVVR